RRRRWAAVTSGAPSRIRASALHRITPDCRSRGGMSGQLRTDHGSKARQVPGRVMVLGDPASFEPWFLDGLSRSCRHLHVVESVDAATEALGVHRPDVILLSERVGQAPGVEILRLLREADGDPAVVIVLAEDGIDRGTEALDAG